MKSVVKDLEDLGCSVVVLSTHHTIHRARSKNARFNQYVFQACTPESFPYHCQHNTGCVESSSRKAILLNFSFSFQRTCCALQYIASSSTTTTSSWFSLCKFATILQARRYSWHLSGTCWNYWQVTNSVDFGNIFCLHWIKGRPTRYCLLCRLPCCCWPGHRHFLTCRGHV